MKKRIVIIGGDGFCGFPLALYLSNQGHEVTIIDNLSRRRIDEELGARSLVPITSIEERLDTWESISGNVIRFYRINVAKDYVRLFKVLQKENPDAIVHLGEQRAAPYSMKSISHMQYTVENNLPGTHNVLLAILEHNPNIHLLHLGTMGVYGYGAIDNATIPEGYIDVEYEGKKMSILHPAEPGSIYHMTKTQDALFFQFFAKNYELRITDLHQGIIWGGETKETQMDKRLHNRFDYDGDYGTVLNRFMVQSMIGSPLTVYGTGEQTRAFIHIEDSMRCVELALNNPPERGERVKIFNQMTETKQLVELAKLIKEVEPSTEISYLDNPRKEARQNTLNASNQQFMDLGLKPRLISKGEILKIMSLIKSYKERVDISKIGPSSFWHRDKMLKKAS